MRNGLWPRMMKHMTQVTRAPGRNGPAFASANHANSALAAAAGTIENTTFLHASPPLVATDKSSKFLSVARMVSACQPMQSCTRTARRRISPRCNSGRRPPVCQSIPSQIPQQPSVASPPTSPRPASSSRAPASCCWQQASPSRPCRSPRPSCTRRATRSRPSLGTSSKLRRRPAPLGVGGAGWARAWAAGTQCGTDGTDGMDLACHRFSARRYRPLFIPPGERAQLALAPHRPASPGAPPAPHAPPQDGALGLITSRWRGTLCARRHLAPSPTGTMSMLSMLTMQPTRRCPQAHRPNAHPPVEGAKLAGGSGGPPPRPPHLHSSAALACAAGS